MKQDVSLFDIHPLSTHDGPGMRTAFFFKGCSLSCSWCQNPESIGLRNEVWHYSMNCLSCGLCIETCPEKAIRRNKTGNIEIDHAICTGCGTCVPTCPGKALKEIGTPYSIENLMSIVMRDKPYMMKKTGGGITVTGGEPLLKADFLKTFFGRCKEVSVHTAVDTCGYVPWHAFETVLPLTDLFLFDIKLMDNKKHKDFTGAGNHLILNNLLRLSHTIRKKYNNTKIWIRTPLIPGATFTKENITEIGEFLRDDMEGRIERWELCSFNPLPEEKYNRLGLTWKYKGVPLMTAEEGEKALAWAKNSFTQPEKVFLTGLTSKE